MDGMRPGVVDYGLMLALAALWGGSFMAIKLAVADIPPMTVGLGRLVLAALVFWAICLAAGRKLPRGRKVWTILALLGVVGTSMPFTLIGWGQEVVGAGPAAILMAGIPLYTLVLAHFFVAGDRLTLGKIVGLVFGLAGLVVLIGPQNLAHIGDDTIRQLAIALAALCYAITAILMKHLAGEDPYMISAVMMLFGIFFLMPLSLLFDAPWTLQPGAVSVIAVIALGLLPTALANVLMLALLRRQGASFFAQINFLVPLFGVGWGMLVLAERPGAEAFVALALILTGITITRIWPAPAKPSPELPRP